MASKSNLKQSAHSSGVNIELSEKLVTQLVRVYGVKTFCLCPGGRNAPLISVISGTKGLEVFSFFEERSAGFFAMGLCRKNQNPSAVVTTSGTAVAELLPSVIEAYYSNIPLVLITADRPSSYRGTGAPQSIEQPGIFSHYVTKTWEVERRKKWKLSSWDRSSPCHVNICFDEPLMDKKIRPLFFSFDPVRTEKAPSSSKLFQKKNSSQVFYSSGDQPIPTLSQQEKRIKSFFLKVKRPLCILTELPEKVKWDVEDILCFFPWPIYAEALSGLRESEKLKPLILKSGELVLKWLMVNKQTEGVLRIGRRPCTRFWRDLEKIHSYLPVLSVSDQSYSGLSRAQTAVSFSAFFRWSRVFMEEAEGEDGVPDEKPAKVKKIIKKTVYFHKQKEVLAQDMRFCRSLNKLISKYPLSEPALVKQFSKKIPSHSLLFLGNSLPIREWNLSADYQPDKQLKYIGNRGANGIDGLVSTFLGLCEPNRQNWCLIGDLSCLYDLSAPWISSQLDPSIKWFLVVINNTGGRIFSSLFSDPIFLNSHNLQFKKWAEMWKLNYYCLHRWPKTFAFSSPAVIELKVNLVHTHKFEIEYHRLKNTTGP